MWQPCHQLNHKRDREINRERERESSPQWRSRSLTPPGQISLSLSRSLGLDNNPTGIFRFMEGIFSCCREERIMVFTMNERKEDIDPTVMRAGLFDVHVHFPLCDFPMFKVLEGSYLGLKDHKLYPQVEEIFQARVRLSEIKSREIMIANKGSPSRAI